jgi:molybdopterin synthase catalytic subunit
VPSPSGSAGTERRDASARTGVYTIREAISPQRLLGEVASPTCGATCLFLGTVRDGPEDGGVTAIEYTAYEAMVTAELDRILADARRQWPGARLAVCHRLGLVPTEEASIGIAAAAAHRAEAFAACRFVIEEVKRRVPVWKKELRADGSALWVDPQGRPAVVGPE